MSSELVFAPALSQPHLLAAPVAAALRDLADAEQVEVAEIDAALADTAAFCERYGVSPAESANCVVIAAKRGGVTSYAACMVAATTRADVNGLVRRHLDARKASFAPVDTVTAASGMEYGGITPIGLPAGWPVLVDEAVAKTGSVVIGSGIRGSKLRLPGELLAALPSAQVLPGLGLPVGPLRRNHGYAWQPDAPGARLKTRIKDHRRHQGSQSYMKRGRLTAAVIAAISVPALGLGLGLGASAINSAAQASSRISSAGAVFARHFSAKPVVADCQGQPQVRPAKLTLSCADGNDYLTGLSWRSWTAGLASATGVQEVNDCLPYCAAGHFHGYPVDVIFWGGTSLPGHPGSQRYTSITLLYPGARPNVGAHRGPGTVTLPLLAAPS